MGFSQAQDEAIHHGRGPAMVLAGPGSGKTMVITHRVRNLIQEYGITPGQILVITFTRAAAKEMEERFVRLMGGRHLPVTFGTFHAVFFRILRYAYNYSASNIIRQEQQYAFLKDLLGQIAMDTEDEGEKIQEMLAEISLVKGDGLALENYYSRTCPSDIFHQIYQSYEDYLRRSSLIDFDDMMKMCMELFEQRPDILASWQQKYRYILIDEFQDINRLQYDIVRMLARPEHNLFIVGDDDQSIYRFRGARPEIMLGFEKDYPGWRRVLLDINYRSVPSVVRSAGNLIHRNKARFQKEIHPARREEVPVSVRSYPDLAMENCCVIRQLQEYHAKGIPYDDMALLYRTNSNPQVMAEQLIRCNLPFCMNEVVPNLYEHWISRDILTYMLIAAGSRARGDYLRIINRPKRYISRSVLNRAEVDLEELKTQVSQKAWMVERIERLEYDLQMIGRMRPWAAINYIRKAVGYDDFVREYAEYRRIRPEELFGVLDELQESAQPFAELDEWLVHMQEYARELQLQREKDKSHLGVQIMTMHSSKGLEYSVVFLMDANEGITPHHKAVLDADMEEERRLFYVGMTRAKTFLHICLVRERFNREVKMSRFVEETGIPVEIVESGKE